MFCPHGYALDPETNVPQSLLGIVAVPKAAVWLETDPRGAVGREAVPRALPGALAVAGDPRGIGTGTGGLGMP